jgi:hypothetical protein
MLTQVIDKEVTTEDGRKLFLKIVQHGDKRGWMTKQLCNYFGKDQSAISYAAKKAGIQGMVISHTQIQPLKVANVVDINTTHMKFYTEEEIARIAFHLRSQEAQDMVVYGFGVGVRAAQGKPLDIGLETDWKVLAKNNANQLLSLIEKLEKAETDKAVAEAQVIKLKDYAVHTARTNALVAREIAQEYPLIRDAALRWYESKWPRVSIFVFQVPARITTYLKWVHGLADKLVVNELVKVKGEDDQKERALFNRADIEAVNEKLKKEQV